MIFRSIERSLALQLTVFVFGLLFVNGVLFLIADTSNSRREQGIALLRESQIVQRLLPDDLTQSLATLPPRLRERVRVVDQDGDIFYEGAFFNGLPFAYSSDDGIVTVYIQDDPFDLMTAPVVRDEKFLGYMQIMRPQQATLEDLPLRVTIYMLVSLGISAVTYFVGRYFARLSLRPAEDAMQRLEQFTQDASHELRTPLTVLGSSLDLALRTKKYEQGLASAKEDLQEIVRLVERMLELARLDRTSISLAPFNLTTIIQGQLEKIQPAAAVANIALKSNIAKDVTVLGDAALMPHIIGNLLTNAVKFTPAGGTITVTLTPRSLVVTDTGKGIHPDVLPFIFERFFQSDHSRSQGGYGLGLALVKRIVDLHDWRIDVESAIDQGTTFTIRFPSRSA